LSTCDRAKTAAGNNRHKLPQIVRNTFASQPFELRAGTFFPTSQWSQKTLQGSLSSLIGYAGWMAGAKRPPGVRRLGFAARW
jgi:hypothetical protein